MDNRSLDVCDDPIMHRVQELERTPLEFTLDGNCMTGYEGDTILMAILTHKRYLRTNEFSHTHRAGFCLMGACQDCWVWDNNGRRLRSCSTAVKAGMVLHSTPVLNAPNNADTACGEMRHD